MWLFVPTILLKYSGPRKNPLWKLVLYPSELQLNLIPRPHFLDLHLSISNGFVSSKIYYKRDDFNIVNFPFLNGDVPRRPSYGVNTSQLIRFARVCSHIEDLNARNTCLTVKLLKQGYRYHKLRKAFSKFYRRHYELILKFNVRLRSPFKSRPIGTRILW